MWTVVHLHGSKESYLIKTGITTVGRKECDIMVNDKSVSRKHANIELEFDGESVEDPSSGGGRLFLVDKSKFGTWLNNNKCTSTKLPLTDGAEIRFGVSPVCTYRVVQQPLVIFWDPESLSSKAKSAVLRNVALYGGRLSTGSAGCTYSLLQDDSEITFATRHLLRVLLQGLPCITPSWLTALSERPTALSPLPDPERYHPSVKAPWREHVKFDGSHATILRTLFVGKTFVFLTTEQYEEFEEIITLASGGAMKCTEQEYDSAFFTKHLHSCIVNPPTSARQSPIIKAKLQEFATLGVTPIEDAEISNAIIYRDTTTYCNPTISLPPDPPSSRSPMIISILDDEEDDQPPKPSIATKTTQPTVKVEPPSASPTTTTTSTSVIAKTEKPGEVQATRAGKRKRVDEDTETKTEEDPPADVTRPVVKHDPSLPSMMVAQSTLLARPLAGGTPVGVNFKRFKKSKSLTSEEVSNNVSPSPRVIKCVLEESKPTEEMDAWLKEGATAEKAKRVEDDAAELLWNNEGGKPSKTKGTTKAATAKKETGPRTRRKSNLL